MFFFDSGHNRFGPNRTVQKIDSGRIDFFLESNRFFSSRIDYSGRTLTLEFSVDSRGFPKAGPLGFPPIRVVFLRPDPCVFSNNAKI